MNNGALFYLDDSPHKDGMIILNLLIVLYIHLWAQIVPFFKKIEGKPVMSFVTFLDKARFQVDDHLCW